jgi:hypothetical protein
MKPDLIVNPTLAVAVLAMAVAVPASADPKVRPQQNGNVAVQMDGCSVLFAPGGQILSQDKACKDKQVRKAEKKFASYQKNHKAAPAHAGGKSTKDTRDKAAASQKKAGEPEEWLVRNVRGNTFGLQKSPSENAPYVNRGIRNGTRMRNLGCSVHDGETWCKAQLGKNTGWAQRRYLSEVGG